jgi:hypothetical protein
MIDLKEVKEKHKKDTEKNQVEYQCSECGRYCIAKTIGEPICCLFNGSIEPFWKKKNN